jgi:hypothetical protein
LGKATIYSHLGEGRYSIGYHRDTTYAQQQVDRLTTALTAIQAKLYEGSDSLLDRVQKAWDHFLEAKNRYDQQVLLWAECVRQLNCSNGDEMMKKALEIGKEAIERRTKWTTAKAAFAEAKAQQITWIDERARYQNEVNKQTEVIQAWAVDHPGNTPLPPMTVVGTIETGGVKGATAYDFALPKPYINILPHASAPYNAGRDYCIQALGSQSTATALSNATQFLAVLTANPRYSIGKITAIDKEAETASVTIWGTTPTASAPTDWQPVEHAGVPIQYPCGAEPFEVDDLVVVQYSGQFRASPAVIGFAEEPESCSSVKITYIVQAGGTLIGQAVQHLEIGAWATPVSVELAENAFLTGWSDGHTSASRHDQAGEESVTYTANVVVNQSWLAHFPTELYMTLARGNADPQGAVDCNSNMTQRRLTDILTPTSWTKTYGEPAVQEHPYDFPENHGRSYWIISGSTYRTIMFKYTGYEQDNTYSFAESTGYLNLQFAVESPPEFACGPSRIRYRSVRANAGTIANGSYAVRKGWWYDCVTDITHGGGTAWRNWTGQSTATAYSMEQLDALIRSSVPAKITLVKSGIGSKVYVRLDNSVFWRTIYGITSDITQDIWVREDKFGQITREQAAPINWSDWEASKEPTPFPW